jgi:hypothetical protein
MLIGAFGERRRTMSHLKFLPARCRLISVAPEYPRKVLGAAAFTLLAACSGEEVPNGVPADAGRSDDQQQTADGPQDSPVEDSYHMSDGLPVDHQYVPDVTAEDSSHVVDGLPADDNYVPDAGADELNVADGVPADNQFVPEVGEDDTGED